MARSFFTELTQIKSLVQEEITIEKTIDVQSSKNDLHINKEATAINLKEKDAKVSSLAQVPV